MNLKSLVVYDGGGMTLKSFISSPLFLSIVVGIILTVILTWPLTPHIGTYFTDQGDYVLGGTNLWYNQDAIVTGRIFNPTEYWKGYQFYPQPLSLNFSNNMVAPTFIFAPIFWLTHNFSLSVNLFAMLTLFLSYLSAFYAINYFVKNKWASLVGAAIFAFNAQTMVRFPQHLDVLNTYFLPLVFLFAYQFLEKPTLKKGLLFSLFFTLNALSVTYYQIFSIILLPMVALPFLWSGVIKKDWQYFFNIIKYGSVMLLFVPILLYFDLSYLNFSNKEGATRNISETEFFAARFIDWIGTAPNNLVYGPLQQAIFPMRTPIDDRGILNYEEHSLFLGIMPFILFIMGWGIFSRSLVIPSDPPASGEPCQDLRRRNLPLSKKIATSLTAPRNDRVGKWYFYILLIVSFLLMFGPYFPPFTWLFNTIPIMKGIRSPTRFEFLFFIPFSIICAYGVLWLFARFPKNITVITIIIIIIVIFENFTVRDFSGQSEMLAQTRSIGVTNLQFLKGKATVHVPIYTTEDADVFGKNSGYLNWVTQTGEQVVNGNTSYLPPDQLGFLTDVKAHPDAESFKKLLALGVRYIIIHKKQMDATIPVNKKAVVLDTDAVQIVDLSKYGFAIRICDLDKDVTKQVTEGVDDTGNMAKQLIVTNQNSCYLPNIYGNRYRKFGGMLFRLPILVVPGEQVVGPEVQ